MVARARRQFDIAQLLQLPTNGRFCQRDAKLIMEPPRQVDQPPAHNSMDRRDRAAFNDVRKSLTLGIIQQAGLARGFAVKEAVGATGIEPHDPVAHDLQAHPADARGIAAAPAVVNFRQRQQTTPWFALFVLRASRLKPAASKSSRNPIAAPMAMPSNRLP